MTYGLAGPAASRHGPVTCSWPRGGSGSQLDGRRRAAAEADVTPAATRRLTLHVEARLPAADQFQLAEQGRELARRRLPHQLPRLVDDSPRLRIPAARAEVPEQARAKVFCLANVDQVADHVHHAV